MRKATWLCVLALALAVPAMAQDEHPRAEAFGGYSYVRVSDQGTSVNLNGGSGSISVNPNHWLGLVADFGGYHFNQSGVSGSVITYLFGPKIAFRGERVTPFAQALFGGAHISVPIGSSSASENAFAMALGGGLDVKVAQHFAVRLIQAEYLMTKFNDGANNRQNNARISAGIVVRF